MDNFFDTIGGLPLHPLTVHAAAVLIPLSALALAILVFVPRWRKTYFPLTIGFLAVSVGLAFAAKQSGEALAERVGNPASHQALGDIMFPASIGLFFLGIAFYLITRTERPKWTMQLAGSLATVGVVGVVVLSVLVGHSGAEATWASRISAGQGQDLPGITDPSASPGAGITAAEVAQHNTAADCWSVINGNVYDLTTYLPRHKGGPGVLTAICGKDGTSAFTGQHSGQTAPAADLSSLLVGPFGAAAGVPGASKPANVLAAFALGPLAGTSTLPNAQVTGEEGEEGEEGDD